MTDSVSNNNISNSYTYNNSGLKKYDVNDDGELSLYEIENIEDDEGIQLLTEDIENQQTEGLEEEDKETQISNLESLLGETEDNQGIFGKAWNGLKSVTGIGSSTKKCEQAIEDFKNGKITYDEAYTQISEFSEKQESSVNFAANMVSGAAAVLVVGSAVLTGGLSLGVVAGAAAIGAGTKAGLKFADRATNEVKGDALDAKQIAKDSVSGAVNGAVSAVTMGMGSTAAVTGETVAAQTLKQTVIQGAKAGAAEGAVSGAVIGASDYTIEAAFEDDVEFNVEDLAKSTATSAAGGAVFGGIIGGVSSGIQYQKVSSKLQNNAVSNIETANTVNTDNPIDSAAEVSNPSQISDSPLPAETELTAGNTPSAASEASDVIDSIESSNSAQISDTPSLAETELTTGNVSNEASKVKIPEEIQQELNKQADDMNKLFESNIEEARKQIDDEFGSLSSVEKNGITGRAKSKESILSKLEKKYENGKLVSTSTEACTDAIGDAYGTRIQVKSLSAERSQEIIEDCLYGSDISYEQFINYMNGDTLDIDKASITALDEMKDTIIDLLKEEQTKEVADQLIDAIGKGRLTITELNNYGDDISSYFTNTQLQAMADAYYIQTGEDLPLVTKYDYTSGSGIEYDMQSSADYTAKINTEKAVKDTGYATSQMNTKQPLSNNTIGNGELQIRGTAVNKLADSEHIIYDITGGKIKSDTVKYPDYYKIITQMKDDGTLSSYNKYMTETYNHLRLKELGIETVKPDITEYVSGISEETAELLCMEGLIKASQR